MDTAKARIALAFWIVVLASSGPTLWGRDAFVLLSGGDSPLDNNYSQYLQAKAMVSYFEGNYPPDSVWVFFGAGNVEGQPPIFGDVRRKVRRNGTTLDSWFPGALSRNRPAKSEIFLRALRQEILPAIAPGGTLYLFVGDHGAQSTEHGGESIINLWTLERDSESERGWRVNSEEVLGVAELRGALQAGIGKGRVVFCMTQCHAGGFHYLSVPREMVPNPKWFLKPPAWAQPKKQAVLERAAGFTATDEESAAAGCDPDPDPDSWAGYERFIPEQLLGADLFGLETKRRALRSFVEAHVAATLIDVTIDKPYSTSEHYLARWAALIETRLVKETNVTEKVKKQLSAFADTLDGATPNISNQLFRERQGQFHRFITQLTEQNPGARELLANGTKKELEAAIRRRGRSPRPGFRSGTNAWADPPPSQPEEPRPRRRVGREIRKLFNDQIRPGWKRAIQANEVSEMDQAQLRFEKHLLDKEAQGTDYLFSDTDELEEEIFWESGYSNPATLDPERAEKVVRWANERQTRILDWALQSKDLDVRAAAEKVLQLRPRRRPAETSAPEEKPGTPAPAEDTMPLISRRVAAERVLFYRRVLGAWEFLFAMNERAALARVQELTLLEQTPMPRAPTRR